MQSESKNCKADGEHKLQLERERLREYRQRVKQDPEKSELQKIRSKERYRRQKENKRIEKLKKLKLKLKNQNGKLNDELILDEVSRRRRQWKINAKRYREKKKKLKESSVIDEDSLPVKEEEKLCGNRNLRISKDVQQALEIKTKTVIKEELDLDSDSADENILDTEVVKRTSESNTDLIEKTNHTEKRKSGSTRTMRNACLPEKCTLRCSQRLPQEKRVEIFHNFWKLPNHMEKWEFISRNIKLIKTKTKSPRSKRNHTRCYSFDADGGPTRICRIMFEATLGVSSKWINKALCKYEKKEPPKGKMSSMCEVEKCKLSCGKRLISEEDRKAIFQDFWQLSDSNQRSEYIDRNIELSIANNEAGEMYKTVYFTRRYFFELEGIRIRVCKKTFSATLGITDQTVSNVVRSLHEKEHPSFQVDHKGNCVKKNCCIKGEASKFLFVDTDAVADTEEMNNFDGLQKKE